MKEPRFRWAFQGLATLAFILLAQPIAALSNEKQKMDVADLINNAEAFHGKTLGIIGVMRTYSGSGQVGTAQIYTSIKDYETGTFEESVWISFSLSLNESHLEKLALLEGKKVIAYGKFDSRNRNFAAGLLNDVVRVEPFQKSLRPKLNVVICNREHEQPK